MIAGVTPKERLDVVITHYSGLAVDFNRFVNQTKRASPTTQVLLFCRSGNLNGLRFDDVVFENGPDSIEILERRVGLLVLSHGQH